MSSSPIDLFPSQFQQPKPPISPAETPAIGSNSSPALTMRDLCRAGALMIGTMFLAVGCYCWSNAGQSQAGQKPQKSITRLFNPINLMLWMGGSENDLQDVQEQVIKEATSAECAEEIRRQFSTPESEQLQRLMQQPMFDPSKAQSWMNSANGQTNPRPQN